MVIKMEENYDIKKLSLYILIIMAVLLVFYGITVIVTNNQSTNEENSEQTTVIDYEKILVKNIYTQKEETYYVFASMPDDTNLSSYESSISTYSELKNSLKVYTVDLSDAFNKKYVSDESNFNDEYPIFKETTILKIENKKITETYEGEEQISAILNILTQTEES
jgi:hypothetical protein